MKTKNIRMLQLKRELNSFRQETKKTLIKKLTMEEREFVESRGFWTAPCSKKDIGRSRRNYKIKK